MIKASHNTFSYYKPRQWYLRPFAFIAKCQSKSLAQQIEEGIRVFDLRLRMDKDGEWIIAHNAFIYVKGFDKIMHILDLLNAESKYSDKQIYVRVLHEVRNNRQALYSSSIDFNLLCDRLTKDFPNLRFFGGQRTMDWRQDYVFPSKNCIEYIERHASVRWPKWLHWWPWLYAKLYNKANERMYKNKDVVVFTDFV